ncbi:MAG TPA: hypothetical protein V6C65_04665 [Allocoleopsis sp.]
MSSLILPGDPRFDFTLGTCLPGGWQQVQAQTNGEFVFVARSGSGLLEAVPWQEAEEYLEGGEYEQRLAEIGEGEDGATISPAG